jgi:hypothetical protein
MKEPSEDDPLDLERVDQEIRINKLRHQIEEVTGEEFISGKCEDTSPDLEESFLEHVLAMEEHGFTRPFDVLAKNGVALPPPDELDDANLSDVLWKLIHACAKHRLFFYHTDHLSDRELYTYFWSEGLREEMMGFGLPYGNTHLDLIGSGSDDDITLGLRYYHDDEERAQWAKDFPDFEIPPREKPPFDRDRHLPKATYD